MANKTILFCLLLSCLSSHLIHCKHWRGDKRREEENRGSKSWTDARYNSCGGGKTRVGENKGLKSWSDSRYNSYGGDGTRGENGGSKSWSDSTYTNYRVDRRGEGGRGSRWNDFRYTSRKTDGSYRRNPSHSWRSSSSHSYPSWYSNKLAWRSDFGSPSSNSRYDYPSLNTGLSGMSNNGPSFPSSYSGLYGSSNNRPSYPFSTGLSGTFTNRRSFPFSGLYGTSINRPSYEFPAGLTHTFSNRPTYTSTGFYREPVLGTDRSKASSSSRHYYPSSTRLSGPGSVARRYKYPSHPTGYYATGSNDEKPSKDPVYDTRNFNKKPANGKGFSHVNPNLKPTYYTTYHNPVRHDTGINSPNYSRNSVILQEWVK